MSAFVATSAHQESTPGREFLASVARWRGMTKPIVKSMLKTLLPPPGRSPRTVLDMEHTTAALEDMFGKDLHLARVRSLANGVAGVLNASRVSIAAVGRAIAQVRQIEQKSGIKQVDRLLSNEGVSLDVLLPLWTRQVVGTTPKIVVAMDWTDFDDDDHTTLCVSLITKHGRATPLAWRTEKKTKLATRRTACELTMIEDLHRWLPVNVAVTLLGDRAFGYEELYALLEGLGWDYVLRFRQNIMVAEPDAEAVPASSLVLPRGRVRKIVGARVTRKLAVVPAVVLVKRARMKEAWCLATSLATADANEIVKTYSRRFTIEETFRDTKDLTFGMGLRATHIRGARRRDRMLFLVALAHTLLTLLGAAGEACGLDRTLKTNTSKKRTLSLFNQGREWYLSIPNMREAKLATLIGAYEKILREHTFLGEILKYDAPAET